MKELKKYLGFSLYLVLPIGFFAILYLAVAFVVMTLDPRLMSEDTRSMIVILGYWFMAAGGWLAYLINK